MLTKVCIAAAVALGCILIVPSSSFAADDKDKPATVHPKKAKKGHSDVVHENAGHRPKKGHADDVHQK